MTDESNIDEDLLNLSRVGDDQALAKLFGKHRDRLRQMVHLRLDRRLQGRVDPSDVLQEAYLDITKRLPEYSPSQRCRRFSGSGC